MKWLRPLDWLFVPDDEEGDAEPPVVLLWAADASFWRDVAAQTLSTLLAAIVIAIVFIFSGGYSESVRYYVAMALLIAFVVIAIAAWIYVIFKDIWKPEPPTIDEIVRFTIVSFALLLLGLWLYNYWDEIAESLARWAEAGADK